MTHEIPIVGNFGAGQSEGGAAAPSSGSRTELGLTAPKIAVVEGDDLSDRARARRSCASYLPKEYAERPFASANVYQGASRDRAGADAKARRSW